MPSLRRSGGCVETFGNDYQAGTGNGASGYGIPLRLAGQSVDDTSADATSGAGGYYNVRRWREPATGRFTRREQVLDPELLDLAYTYAGLKPKSLNPLRPPREGHPG